MDNIIRVKKRGSFHVGGEKITLKDIPTEDFQYLGNFTFHSDPNGSHWTKQMYVQYTRLAEPVCPYPVLMWHGGGLTGVTFETTPDGREGWDTLFLRAGFDVFVSDAVERGRASWAKFPEINPTPPIFHTYEARWLNLRMGETYPIPYEGNRFPTDHYDQLMMQGVPRWLSSDQWAVDAYCAYLERMKGMADGVILLAHSQGCSYAMEVALKYPKFVKALILVEQVAIPAPEVDLSPLAQIQQLYVYGDFMDLEVVHPWVSSLRPRFSAWKDRLKAAGIDYTWMDLPAMGIKGNSHMLMMDNNNDQIANMVCDWIKEHVK